ncbi:MAG: DUF6232 family protein [Chloroflexia bacterium]
MSDAPYFADEAVHIDSREARFSGKSYPLEEIRAAYVDTRMLEIKYGDWRDLVGKFCLVLVALAFLISVFRLIEYVPLGLLLIALFVYTLQPGMTFRYVVRLVGSFGEQDVLIARNHKYAKKVARVVREAMKSHRKQRANEPLQSS